MTFRSMRALAVLGSSVLLVVACAQGSAADDASDVLPTEPPSSAGAATPEPAPAPAPTSKGDAGSKPAPSGTSTSSSSGGTSTSSSSGGTSTSSSSGGTSTSSSSSSSGGATTCPGYARPNDFDLCNACGTKSTCQANGCYGGYYCRDADLKCVTKPTGC